MGKGCSAILTWFFSMTLFNIKIALEFCSQIINQKCPAVCGKGPWVKIYLRPARETYNRGS